MLFNAPMFDRVFVEISNVCNLQCAFCPEVEREKSFMDEATFSQVIGQVAPLTKSVCFHLMGEPLVHKNFARFVEISGAHNLSVQITTNGTLLDEERSLALLNP